MPLYVRDRNNACDSQPLINDQPKQEAMIFHKVVCALRGHKYVIERVFGPYTRKVGCTRCDRKWAMNDDVKAFLPWDDDFERFYKAR